MDKGRNKIKKTIFWKFHNYNYNIDMRIFRTINVMTIKKERIRGKWKKLE